MLQQLPAAIDTASAHRMFLQALYTGLIRTGIARILSGGALFLAQTVDDLFLVVALKDRLEIYLPL